jgi:tetratricopeptide (TPR) repeat protein
MSRMRALSVRQPWAWAICAGIKRVENRTWSVDYRGPVAIHAAAAEAGIREFQERLDPGLVPPAALSLGSVVGVAELVDVAPLRESLEEDPDAVGPLCWIFANPRLFSTPIPAKGKTSLFYLSEDTSQAVAIQLQRSEAATAEHDAELLTALRLSPWELDLSRADCYCEAEQGDAALRCCSKAIALEPTIGEGYRLRGSIYQAIGDGGAALRDLDHAISIDPNDAGAYWLRAKTYELLGNQNAANADYAKCDEIDPELAAELEASEAEPNGEPQE